jgi:hypothetical protein
VNKVYIVNKGGHDHSDATRFGELIFLSEGAINRYSTGNIYRTFVEILKESKAEDYILITGLSVMSSIACAIFSRMHGRINLLLYKSSRGAEGENYYIERTVMIDELL